MKIDDSETNDLSYLIAKLISTFETATTKLLLSHNARHLTSFSVVSKTTKQTQRYETLALKIRSSARIQLNLARRSKNENEKFIFDSDRGVCDVLLHEQASGDGISRKHFRIIMNTNIDVLVINDEFIHDIIIIFRQSEKSKLRKISTSVFCHDDIQIELITLCFSISFRDFSQDVYDRN